MNLYDFLLYIQEKERLKTTDFIDKSGLSNGVYYQIKNGNKTELKPLQLSNLKKAFPNFDYTLLGSETVKNGNNVINEPEVDYKGSPNLSSIPNEVFLFEVLNRWEALREMKPLKIVLESEQEVAVSKRVIEIYKSKKSLQEYLNS